MMGETRGQVAGGWLDATLPLAILRNRQKLLCLCQVWAGANDFSVRPDLTSASCLGNLKYSSNRSRGGDRTA